MKKILFIMFVVFGLVACSVPIIPDASAPVVVVGPSGTDGTDGVVSPPPVPPSMGDGVKVAKYIRLPGSVVSRGMAGAFTDPDEGLCTEPESVYIFYDDNSIVQYKPMEGWYSNLADRGRQTVEIHNRDNPTIPWDYIAVAPPPPPGPDTSHDPVLQPLEVALVDDAGIIHWSMICESEWYYDYITVGSNTLNLTLELWNRDNDPDCHIVVGGKMPE